MGYKLFLFVLRTLGISLVGLLVVYIAVGTLISLGLRENPALCSNAWWGGVFYPFGYSELVDKPATLTETPTKIEIRKVEYQRAQFSVNGIPSSDVIPVSDGSSLHHINSMGIGFYGGCGRVFYAFKP